MVLHILSDDKFTDYAIKQFQAEELQSEMVVIPFGAGQPFTICDKVRVISYPSPQFAELLTNLGNYSGIVLHGLFWPYCEDIINATPNGTKIAWCFWGGELYSRFDVMLSFLAPITKFLYKVHFIKKRQTYRESFPWQLPIEYYKRIDYCITSEYEEYEYARKYTGSSMQYLWYTYYSIEETLCDLINKRRTGKNLMLCNSAAQESNVFDATLRFLLPQYRKKLNNREVIMPLSYGSSWVRNIMLKIGPLFFKKFNPLINFIPRNDYNQIMLSCSTIILPYYSPAGQGNIITALWLGLRVYLSEKSIAYNYFKRIGMKIFSFESEFVQYGCDELPDNIVEHNRQILINTYSHQQISKCNKYLIEMLEEKEENSTKSKDYIN